MIDQTRRLPCEGRQTFRHDGRAQRRVGVAGGDGGRRNDLERRASAILRGQVAHLRPFAGQILGRAPGQGDKMCRPTRRPRCRGPESRVFFQHRMGIGAAKAKGADARASGRPRASHGCAPSVT